MEVDTESLKHQIADLQGQVHKQEKMASLGLLSAGIAHEIQNPLNFVINFSKMSLKLLEDMKDILDGCKDKLDEDDAADLQDMSEDLQESVPSASSGASCCKAAARPVRCFPQTWDSWCTSTCG